VFHVVIAARTSAACTITFFYFATISVQRQRRGVFLACCGASQIQRLTRPGVFEVVLSAGQTPSHHISQSLFSDF
jgi:hypothetical protein